MTSAPRRIVTGHRGDGVSTVIADGPAPVTRTVGGGSVFHEVWNTTGPRPPIEPKEPEPTQFHAEVPPPPDGSIIRYVEIPAGARSPMHRTETVDYGIVLSGEVYLVLEGAETCLRTGDVVVQRGTTHAWENRSNEPSTMVFVLIAARFSTALRELLGPDVELMVEPPT